MKNVLIAEDHPRMRRILASWLSEWGYEVTTAGDGDSAWEILQAPLAPRLAVMDWIMPGQCGIDVCRKVRARPDAESFHLILVTSQSAPECIVDGLNAGANDFLTKPLNAQELRARVGVGQRIISYQEALAEKNAELEHYSSELQQLVEKRAKQIIRAEHMATLGLLAAGLAHEINNPITFISGNTQILERFWQDILHLIQDPDAVDEALLHKRQFIAQEVPKMFASMRSGTERITRIVNGLLRYARQKGDSHHPCDLNRCVEVALELCQNALKYHVTVEKGLDQALPLTLANEQQLQQVLVNLVLNAAEAMKGQGSGTLSIRTCHDEQTIRLIVTDTGPGIEPQCRDAIWTPFFTTKDTHQGCGLGLSISHDIIRNHGGTISVENQTTGGARFIITLPLIKLEESYERPVANCG